MAKPVKFDESGDSEDLQALFDSIAAGSPPPAATPEPDASGDSPDLQALFDSVAAQVSQSGSPPAPAAAEENNDKEEVVFNRIGRLARQLHDTMRELGYDRMIEETARQLPDAQQRLHYIAQMTEQAASKVLNATDLARPLQDELLAEMRNFGERWEKMFANQLSVDEFKVLAADTRAFFQQAPEKVEKTNALLTEIMMAQDFQDLTGQVIKKVVEMAQNLEAQLVQVLIEVMPEERKATAVSEGLLNGPVINAEGRSDVVTSQAQVDELLESLGF